jgi:hypothetical protein
MVEALYFPNMNNFEGVTAYKQEVAKMLAQGYTIISSIPLIINTRQGDESTQDVIETILVTFAK